MSGKRVIPDGYYTMHTAIESICGGVSEFSDWQNKILQPLKDAVADGKTEFTVRVHIKLFNFTSPKFFKDITFAVSDFYLPEKRDDALGVKIDDEVLKKFEFVVLDGNIRKPDTHMDWRGLLDRLEPEVRILGYQNREKGAIVLMESLCNALIEFIKKQAGLAEVTQITLPDYLLVSGQAFKTSKIGVFRSMAGGPDAINVVRFCLPLEDLRKVKDMCREKPNDEWVSPLPEDRTCLNAAPALLNIPHKAAYPIIASIKKAYLKHVIASARAIDTGDVPPTHFEAQFTIEIKATAENFKVLIPADSCATFINPANTFHRDLYLTRTMLRDILSPQISLGWKLSHNVNAEKDSPQPMHNIRHVRHIALAKLAGTMTPAEAAKAADVVAYLAHDLTSKVFKHKLSGGNELEFRGKKINIDEFAFAKVKRFYRFSLSDSAMQKLIEIARTMPVEIARKELGSASVAENRSMIQFTR